MIIMIFKAKQVFTSIFERQMIIKQINKDYYGRLFLLVDLKNGLKEEWFSEQGLENFILDYSYQLQG